MNVSTPSFKQSLIVEQFQGNYLKSCNVCVIITSVESKTSFQLVSSEDLLSPRNSRNQHDIRGTFCLGKENRQLFAC